MDLGMMVGDGVTTDVGYFDDALLRAVVDKVERDSANDMLLRDSLRAARDECRDVAELCRVANIRPFDPSGPEPMYVDGVRALASDSEWLHFELERYYRRWDDGDGDHEHDAGPVPGIGADMKPIRSSKGGNAGGAGARADDGGGRPGGGDDDRGPWSYTAWMAEAHDAAAERGPVMSRRRDALRAIIPGSAWNCGYVDVGGFHTLVRHLPELAGLPALVRPAGAGAEDAYQPFTAVSGLLGFTAHFSPARVPTLVRVLAMCLDGGGADADGDDGGIVDDSALDEVMGGVLGMLVFSDGYGQSYENPYGPEYAGGWYPNVEPEPDEDVRERNRGQCVDALALLGDLLDSWDWALAPSTGDGPDGGPGLDAVIDASRYVYDSHGMGDRDAGAHAPHAAAPAHVDDGHAYSDEHEDAGAPGPAGAAPYPAGDGAARTGAGPARADGGYSTGDDGYAAGDGGYGSAYPDDGYDASYTTDDGYGRPGAGAPADDGYGYGQGNANDAGRADAPGGMAGQGPVDFTEA